MGEYAIRKSDGTEIKIGTCEEMYYLRFEDRGKVIAQAGNVDPVLQATELRFRLPFPDEDDTPIGQYKIYNRGQLLFDKNGDYFSDPSNVNAPGLIQLHHDCGILMNLPCYHGEKLPEPPPDGKIFWNGKASGYELSQLRPVDAGNGELRVLPIVHCKWCGQAWRYQWQQIWEFVPFALRVVLRPYAEACAMNVDEAEAAMGVSARA